MYSSPNQTKESIKAEASDGLAVAAAYFQTTLGIPFEIFREQIESLPSDAHRILWYMNFRSQHPELYKVYAN